MRIGLKKKTQQLLSFDLVGMTGFEPATPSSRTKYPADGGATVLQLIS